MDKLKQILIKREQEIKEGKNAYTVPPLYVVYEEVRTFCEHTSQYDQSTTLFSKPKTEYVRVDGEGEEYDVLSYTDLWSRELVVDEGDEQFTLSEVLRKSSHDRFVTVCFTREAAEEFIKRERHNLRNPRIYVHAILRRNRELIDLLSTENLHVGSDSIDKYVEEN